MVHAGTTHPLLPDYLRVPEILLAADDEALDDAIDEALGALGGAVGVDRAYVFLVRGGVLGNTHGWTDAGIRPETERLRSAPVKVMDAWHDAFAHGEAIHIVSVPDLPPSLGEIRAVLEAQDILSVLIAPLMRGGVPVGFAGFDSVLVPRRFQEAEIAILRATANLIVTALDRRDADRARGTWASHLQRWARSGPGALFQLVPSGDDAEVVWCRGPARVFGSEAGSDAAWSDDAASEGAASEDAETTSGGHDDAAESDAERTGRVPLDRIVGRVHPNDRDAFLASLRVALRDGVAWHTRFRRVARDGTERAVRVAAEPDDEEDGTRSWWGVALDED